MFQKFTELILAHSGALFEATRFSTPCEVSRTTIGNYLNVLEATFVAHVIRPFSNHKPTEIISAPKVYAFDTGFVCYYRGYSYRFSFLKLVYGLDSLLRCCFLALLNHGRTRMFLRVRHGNELSRLCASTLSGHHVTSFLSSVGDV